MTTHKEYKNTFDIVVQMQKDRDDLIMATIKASADSYGISEVISLNEKLIVEALREKQERIKNKPLTPEELQEMQGEPVWCKEAKQWLIVGHRIKKCFVSGLREKKLYLAGLGGKREFEEFRGCTFYRYKPSEDE